MAWPAYMTTIRKLTDMEFNMSKIFRSLIIMLFTIVTVNLTACNKQTPTSLADLDISTSKDNQQQVFIKPKSTDEIRKAYGDYLKNAKINDKTRLDALSRLAEIEFKHSTRPDDDLQTENPELSSTEEDRIYDQRLDKTIDLLSTSLKDYPKAKNNDTLLYQLAKAYAQKGEQVLSVNTLNKLVEDYPKSLFYVESQFRIAEYAFSHQQYSTAEYAYTEVIVSPENTVFYEKSMFKRGWSRFKQQFYTEAVDDFIGAALDHKFDVFEKLSKPEREQFDEYFRAIGLAFSYLGGSEPLYDYFKDQQDFIYTYHTYSMVSEIYLKQERFSDAVDTHQQFIEHYPESDNIPYSYLKIIEIWKNSGFTNKVYKAIDKFYTVYNPSSSYWVNQNENSSINRAIRRSLKEYIVLMANYRHNIYQSNTNNNNYKQAELWYKRYLTHYASYANQDNINFLYAELLIQNKSYNKALQYYERAAFDNELISHKESAYAVIELSDKLFALNKRSKNAEQYRKKSIDYSLKYVQTYPGDVKASKIVKHAAELAYHSMQYKSAIELIDLGLESKNSGDTDYLLAMKANAYFKLAEYAETEQLFTGLLKTSQLSKKQHNEYRDLLSLAIYKQGDKAKANNNIPLTIQHYSRISKIFPDSDIASTGLYDAIALNMQHKQWTAAIEGIKSFQGLYPRHKLRNDVSRKLSVAYLSSNQGIKAAQTFAELASMEGDKEIQAAALWKSAELYEEKKQYKQAIKSYEAYSQKFRKPFAQHLEAMFKLIELYSKNNNFKATLSWAKNIIKADKSALNNSKTDRTRHIASLAYLNLARYEKNRFDKLRLSLPLKKSLKRKKSAMQSSVKYYGKAAMYKDFDFSTEATHSIALIYRDFSKALLTSDRPTNLNTDELDQYEILLEDQAFPFEDKAIEFYEINLSRIKEGFYNPWINQSHQQLISMFPVRYNRSMKEDEYVNVMH